MQKNYKKYDFLANELGLIHGCKTRIIPYVKALEISELIEAYIQSKRRRLNISGEREKRKLTY
ncbi:hypothetical protein NAPIS_ORF01996 [Vairimorpha apis BRL 01]|uniref:Uncharacterized protein n=1 Tax=Vairimorpha apis BRL 01 TaxID=1037528 RepID=T0KYX9_9MICR|nr:hypothetical protein NAPIS_ORF01996 [Vairimorpha apis BRL 01]